MFESLCDRMQGVFKELRGEGHLTDFHLEPALREIRLSLLEADVALPVVRALHGAGQGARGRREGRAAALARPGGHAHRPRRAARASRRRSRGRRSLREARGHRARRSAGLRQDDFGREAGAAPEDARTLSADRGRRPRASGRRGAARHARPPDRRARLRAGRASGPRRGCPRGRQRGAANRPRHGHRRHGRPPARRRGAHGTRSAPSRRRSSRRRSCSSPTR